MTNDADDLTTLTARAVRAVEANAQRATLPREAFLSLPVPIVFAQQPHLVFFWASQGGPANRRTVSAPYARTRVDPEHPEGAVFERLEARTFGFAADASLRPTIGGSVGAGERRAVWSRFYAMTDAVLALYAGEAKAIDTAAAGLLDAYRLLFDRIAVIALLPAYKALSPHFFDWLEALAKAPPLARPGGVYACDGGNDDFSVVKVLAVQDGAVHARLYKERFATRPQAVDPAMLTIAIGHVPLALEGFAGWHPILLAREPVVDAELEGYRQWQVRASAARPVPAPADATMQGRFHANAELVRQVARNDLGVDVQYDETGVRWLDRYIDGQRAAATEAVKASLPSALGSFFGECIRRRFGGQWQHDDAGWTVRISEHVSVFPFNKVQKQLANDQGESLLGLFTSIAPLLAEAATRTSPER